MTVLVTICTNGTALPPAVIFKGKGYLMKWHQDNPAKVVFQGQVRVTGNN